MSLSTIVILIGLVSAILGVLAAATGIVANTLKVIYWGVKLKKELNQK